jgi:hypothetical protein
MQFTVPAEVQQFVRNYIKTLDQLEVLLLLSALPQREWTANAVYRVVLSTPELVQQRLDAFVQSGLFTRIDADPPLYRYGPQSDELAQQVSALAAAFQLGRHKIVELIYPPSSSRDSAKDFSDAFRFKPGKKEN